jgi:hemolysin activation/secretion protein
MDFLNISRRRPKLARGTFARGVVRAAVSAPLAALMWVTEPSFALETTLEPPESPGAPAAASHARQPVVEEEPARPIYIREYRVVGGSELPRIEVEEAVYPFLGPGRTAADVEQARASLEKAYQAKGYQAASVEIPPQQARGGIVVLRVSEGTVGKLRVKGSRYFLPSAIKAQARSLAEGRVVNFNNVTRDIVGLNQLPDRQVTPALRAGAEPGTVDIDLTVKDKLPLHGSLELNNRYSADTTHLRLTGSASYTNLWQAGHTIGGSFQTSPEKRDEVKVYSGYYIARLPNVDWLSLMVQGVKQDSNVNTLGSLAVAGRGEVLGARAIITLPPGKDFFHSVNFGFDYKHFDQQVMVGLTSILTPVTYYPVTAAYTATWAPKGAVTELNAGVTFGVRGVGSRSAEFENNRFDADANFIYVRGDLSHTHDLPAGFEAFAKVQGQISDQPLVNSEQFAGGGLGTVRGYLEAEVLGDNAVFGTVELRSPSLLGWATNHAKANEWRVYVFGDAGTVTLHSPLPEQESSFKLASVGFGSRLRLLNHLNGSIDIALPLIGQSVTRTGHSFLTFRAWADF